MTRTIVYGAALVAFASVTAMTLASITLPNWVSYRVISTKGHTVTRNLGLHQSCSSVSDPACRPFPLQREDCGVGLSGADASGYDRQHFCSMWRSTGFLMSLAAVAELATLLGFLVIMSGGKMKRLQGWKVLASLLAVVAALLWSAMAIVAYLFDHDEQFVVPGWRLDTSWILTTVSASVAAICAAGLAVSAFVLPPEGDYEFLRDPANA